MKLKMIYKNPKLKILTPPRPDDTPELEVSPKKELETELEIAKAEGVVPIILVRNGCWYQWEIPYENFSFIKDRVGALDTSLEDTELLTLGGKLLSIHPFGQYSIDFKQKTGVKKLEVMVSSSETEDRQLLHKLATEFRAKEKLLNRDSLVGTNK